MERTIWKGHISFGLVEIPVGLVSAEEASEIKLSYLDRKDLSPVGYHRYNKTTNEEIEWSQIVRGYEYEKDHYVVLGEDDLKRANPTLTQTIQIESFVDLAEIEPIFYERVYYLQPTRKSKGYVLLRETLRRTQKVGIAKVVLRTRENIAAVAVRGQALVLHLLRFAAEVRSPDELEFIDLDLKDVGVQAKEIEMAERLVADMQTPWKPEDYVDEYTTDLMKVIDAKIEAGETDRLVETGASSVKPKRAKGELIDLMPLLQRSLAAARGEAGPKPTRTSAPRKSRASKSASKVTSKTSGPRKTSAKSAKAATHKKRASRRSA